MIKPKVKIIKPYTTVLFHCKSSFELARTFLRMQEFCESSNPKFKGRYFTLEEYIDWYSYYAKKHDEVFGFDYFEKLLGVNMPGHLVDSFFEIYKDDLSERELFVKNKINELNLNGKYSVIGIYGKTPDAYEHEKRHALYYLNQEYKKEVDKAVSKYKIESLEDYLTSRAYNKSVFKDEIHAYVLTGMPKKLKMGKKDKEQYLKMKKELKSVEKRFIKELI